jgi:putative oxidoreductase
MTRLKTVLPIVVRVMLSGLFIYSVVASVAGSKPPVPAGSSAEAFSNALAATGYMIPLLKLAELAGALMLLRRRFVPLALVILAPVVVNIASFHLFLARGGLPIAVFLVTGMIYLAITHAREFRPLLLDRAA